MCHYFEKKNNLYVTKGFLLIVCYDDESMYKQNAQKHMYV